MQLICSCNLQFSGEFFRLQMNRKISPEKTDNCQVLKIQENKPGFVN